MPTRAIVHWISVLAAVSIAIPAWSAEGQTSGRRIEEVIVTAEKREASIQDTSISITAFTRKE